MENRLPKRLSAWLLTLVMLLSLVPAMGVTASAADDTSYASGSIRNYKSFASYLESGESRDLVLENDFDYTMGYDDDYIRVRNNKKLDLNGHKIRIDASKRAEFYNLITIRSGEFTLYDSKGGGAIEVEFARDYKRHSIIKISPASDGEPVKFTMNGGTLTRLNPLESNVYGDNGCISDDYFNPFKEGERPQITINGGTINCAYDWNGRSMNSVSGVQYMPTALLLRYSQLTVNGGTFNGIVWTDEMSWRARDAEPRVSLNGGVFNFPFAMTSLLKNKTQLVIDGARFNDGLYVAKGMKARNYEGNEPAMLIKSGVFDASGQYLKLDIRSVTADGWHTSQGRQQAIAYAMKLFPNSAIKLNGNIYTSENIGSRVKYADTDGYYLNLNLKGPIEVIGRAWDLKEVLLDGSPIKVPNIRDGALFTVSGSVPVYTVSTLGTHELVYRWYDLAKELKDAGWYYEIRCERGPRLDSIYNGSYTIANGICEWRYRLPNTPANIDAGQMAFSINLRHATDPTSIVYSNQYLLRYQVEKDPIDSVALNVPKLQEGATSGGNFTLSGTNTGVSTINTVWEGIPTTGAVAGNFYAARITLTAKDGYAFNTSTQVKLNGDYLSTGSGIKNGGAGMTIYVNVPVRHEHKYGPWQIAGTGDVHFRKCSCGVQESKPHEWKYLEGKDKYKCTVCGYEIDGEKERITYVYASPRSPIAGEHPGDYTPAEWVKIGGANYKVEDIVWKNMDDTDVTTFEASKIYKGTVTFKADTGFAFDGDRIYSDKIFDSSNAEVVGKYTLADGGTTLTATFKLKDENVVRPALNVKVKLPTLNDQIGQSFPAAELVGTTLPDDVELTSSVYESIFDPPINGSVKPNKTYFYVVNLQFKNSSNDITKAYNVSYTVTDGGDAVSHTDNLAGYGILARYQTPDTSNINVSVRGKVVSYNPGNATTIQLMRGGKKMYQTTIAATTGSGQVPQNFSFPAVAAGTYDLVVTKDAHLSYTVKGVVVGDGPLDLTTMTGKAYQTITLLCGDIDGNGFINSTDLGIILKGQNYGKSTATAGDKAADLDGNGFINSTDLGIVLQGQHYGKSAVSVSFAG